jgi:hypothetical protein
MDLREIWWEGVDLIHVAQDKDQWLYGFTFLVTYLLVLFVPTGT